MIGPGLIVERSVVAVVSCGSYFFQWRSIMSQSARWVGSLTVVGLLGLGIAGCNSGSKDSNKPAEKMEKMDDKMEGMKMDEKGK